jgi:hypothetical protein
MRRNTTSKDKSKSPYEEKDKEQTLTSVTCIENALLGRELVMNAALGMT